VTTVSIRLPEEVETQLAREAQRTNRPKSEIARDAIVDYLVRVERERFQQAIARAALARGPDDARQISDEAIEFDNEALDIADDQSV